MTNAQPSDKCMFCDGTGVSSYRNVIRNGVTYQVAVRCHCSPMTEHDAQPKPKTARRKR